MKITRLQKIHNFVESQANRTNKDEYDILDIIWTKNKNIREKFFDIAVEDSWVHWLDSFYGYKMEFAEVDMDRYFQTRDIIQSLELRHSHDSLQAKEVFQFTKNVFADEIRQDFKNFYKDDYVCTDFFMEDYFNWYNMDDIFIDDDFNAYFINYVEIGNDMRKTIIDTLPCSLEPSSVSISISIEIKEE